LIELYEALRALIAPLQPGVAGRSLQRQPARSGDIPHSLADIERARTFLGYEPACDVARGLRHTVTWYAAASGAGPALTSTGTSQSSLEAS
jgi:UDP-N-acetylglucosamine 4-epimerase